MHSEKSQKRRDVTGNQHPRCFLWIHENKSEYAAIGTYDRDGNDVLITTPTGTHIRVTRIEGRTHLITDSNRRIGPIKESIDTPVPSPAKYPPPGCIEDLGGVVRLVDGGRYARYLDSRQEDIEFCKRWRAAERL
jgi:hypothetical protein